MLEEHRHCAKCGAVIYLQKDRKGGHFPALCASCQNSN